MTSAPAPVAPADSRKLSAVSLGMLAVLLVYVGLGAFTVRAGRFTGDEGWYTFSALEVLRGRVPYRDFLFTQMPAVPYVYAAWLALWGPSVLAARALSCLLGGLAVTCGMVAAGRRGGRVAGLLAGTMLVSNLSFMLDVCSVKTQALTVMMSGLTLLAAAYESSALCAPLLLLSAAALTCTRLSMLPVFPLACVFLWAGPQRRALRVWLVPGLGLMAWAVWAPGAPQNLWFGTVEFHQLWFENPHWSFRWFYALMLRGLVANQGALLALGAGASMLAWRHRGALDELGRGLSRDARFLGFAVASYLTTTAIHFSRPIAYPTYQVSNILYLVIPTAWVWARWCRLAPRGERAFQWALLPVLVLGMPFQDWAAPGPEDGGLARLEEAVRVTRSLAHGRDPIWTMSTELAVESGLPLLSGWEMSEFSWFRELLGREEARARRVVSLEMLAEDLAAARPQLVCLTKRHLQMVGHPALLELLETRYALRAEVSGYGQFSEPLYFYTRRTDHLQR